MIAYLKKIENNSNNNYNTIFKIYPFNIINSDCNLPLKIIMKQLHSTPLVLSCVISENSIIIENI